MKLTVMERLTTLSILPPQGDLTTLRIVRQLQDALSFGEEELARLNVRVEDTSVMWDVDKEQAVGPQEIEIGPKAQGVIREALEKLNKEKKLRPEHLTLCDKFEVGE